MSKQPSVDFRIAKKRRNATEKPSHSVRKLIMQYCFGPASTAKSAAIALSTRLGKSMDDRSPFTLLMLIAYKHDRDADKRILVMWAFPKDEPLQFKASKGRSRIKIPPDIFSRSSSFKKGALFEGIESPQAFLAGRVIDRQAQNDLSSAANYWVDTFLDCRFSLTGKAGTRLLAKLLRATYDESPKQADKDQISNAIVATHASRRNQWSLNKFANEYLEGDVKSLFMKKSPPESRTSSFRFHKSEFEAKLNFRVFRLEDDVRVSAPFGTIGDSVVLDDGDKRRLKVEGTVVDEKVRAKRYA